MSEPASPQSTAALGDVQSVAHAAGRPERFRLKLSLRGKDMKGEWLCRLEGAALAYQNYCATYGTPRVFKWEDIGPDGAGYLIDQEANWLSYESINQCLYMSHKPNRVAWKIVGGRLVRVSDGAVVTWQERQHWPAATDKFLMALPPSAEALTVELVPEPPTPMELILEKMIPVFENRHAPLEAEATDTERYHYGTSPAPFTSIYRGEVDMNPGARQSYGKGKLAFFAVHDEIPSERTVPVYILRRWSREEHRSYYKLALKTEEAGYAVDPLDKRPGPKFRAFDSAQARPHLAQLYEHAAETQTPELRRYKYDFNPEAHDGWSRGTPIFRAITPKEGERALVGTTAGDNAKAYALEWLGKHGEAIAKLVGGRSKDDVQNRTFASDLTKLMQSIPVEHKYTSLGAGGHFGYGIGTAGAEAGAIWRVADYGHVPMHEPFADYSVEWITFGPGTGIEIGGSADVLAVGTWFGDIGQIEGACNGITMGAQVVGGASVTMLWDGSWRGANYTAHPIGVTVVVAAGLEVGGGVFYNASATQFFNRRTDFPKDG